MAKKKKKIKKQSKKDIRKAAKKRLIIIFAIIGMMIFTIVILFLGIKIRFTLNDELNINLEPLEVSINTLRDVPNNVNFHLENNNFFFCKSECTIKFWDISKDILIDSRQVDLKSEENIELEYNVSTDEPGEGQRLFLFETECNNIKTTFCRTNREKRLKSSLITLNYQLSEKEKLLKTQLNKSLHDYLQSIHDLDSQLMTDKAVLENISRQSAIDNKIPKELADALQRNRLDMDLLKNSKEMSEDFRDKWNSLDYLGLSGFKPIIPDIRENIDELITLHNEMQTIATNISLWHPENITIFYTRIEDNDKAFETKKLLSSVNDEFNNINSNNFIYADVINRLENLSRQVSVADNQYMTDLDNANSLLAIAVKRAQALLGENGNVTCRAALDLNKKILMHNAMIPTLQDYVDFRDDTVFQRILEDFKANDNRTINYTNESYEQINFSRLIEIEPIDDRLCRNVSVNGKLVELRSKRIVNNIVPINSNFSTSLFEPKPKCCFRGSCTECCENCKKPYPVIFIHGHASNNQNSPELSLAAFAKMQHRMEGYLNAGEIDFTTDLHDIRPGEWGLTPVPLTIRASYYYISYYDIGGYSVSTRQSDSIENYAIRLKEIIDMVKEKTRRDKVIIVAHSMGGLVAREYLVLFGEDNVDKMILIGTPNKGISGKIEKYCSVLGSDKECEDLAQNSIFLKRLNDPKNDPGIEVHTIAAVGCGSDFDGVVEKNSVFLDFAHNHVIEGTCTDVLGTDLHTNILDPDLYPETFDLIMSILS